MKKILIHFASLSFALTLIATPLEKLKEEIDKSIAKDHIAGVAICVGDLSGIKFSYAQGMSEKGGNTPMTIDTIIDVASVTKVVATTTALAILNLPTPKDIPATSENSVSTGPGQRTQAFTLLFSWRSSSESDWLKRST